MSDIQALRNQVAEALADKPSEQTVGFKANDQTQEQSKANAKAGMSSSKFKQKGNPNKSYSVDVINRAKARIG